MSEFTDVGNEIGWKSFVITFSNAKFQLYGQTYPTYGRCPVIHKSLDFKSYIDARYVSIDMGKAIFSPKSFIWLWRFLQGSELEDGSCTSSAPESQESKWSIDELFLAIKYMLACGIGKDQTGGWVDLFVKKATPPLSTRQVAFLDEIIPYIHLKPLMRSTSDNIGCIVNLSAFDEKYRELVGMCGIPPIMRQAGITFLPFSSDLPPTLGDKVLYITFSFKDEYRVGRYLPTRYTDKTVTCMLGNGSESNAFFEANQRWYIFSLTSPTAPTPGYPEMQGIPFYFYANHSYIDNLNREDRSPVIPEDIIRRMYSVSPDQKKEPFLIGSKSLIFFTSPAVMAQRSRFFNTLYLSEQQEIGRGIKVDEKQEVGRGIKVDEKQEIGKGITVNEGFCFVWSYLNGLFDEVLPSIRFDILRQAWTIINYFEIPLDSKFVAGYLHQVFSSVLSLQDAPFLNSLLDGKTGIPIEIRKKLDVFTVQKHGDLSLVDRSFSSLTGNLQRERIWTFPYTEWVFGDTGNPTVVWNITDKNDRSIIGGFPYMIPGGATVVHRTSRFHMAVPSPITSRSHVVVPPSTTLRRSIDVFSRGMNLPTALSVYMFVNYGKGWRIRIGTKTYRASVSFCSISLPKIRVR